MSNPFEGLAEMYQNTVKENDEAGYSALYKDTFLKIKDYLEKEYHLVMQDINYLDGYFIFGTGTNSVIHFKFKGAKKWQFGLWWSIIEKENMKPRLSAEIFCQHERYLDKFKPSRSSFCKVVSFTVRDDKTINESAFDFNYELKNVGKTCKFVHDHQYLAAIASWEDRDYNTELQRPIKAFIKYYTSGIRKWSRDTFEHSLDMYMYRKLKKYAKEHFDGYKWKIEDAGDYTSPRYELQIELTDEQMKDQETGCFSLFETKEEEDAWYKTKNRLQRFADKFGIWWYSEVSDSLVFWNQKDLEESWNEAENDECGL